jgi:hypothetical protein
VGFRHHEKRTVVLYNRREARPRLGKKRAVAKDAAELLWPVVARNQTRQRTQANAIASRENNAPRPARRTLPDREIAGFENGRRNPYLCERSDIQIAWHAPVTKHTKCQYRAA